MKKPVTALLVPEIKQAPQLLRISTSSNGLSQMQEYPLNSSPSGRGLILNFPQARLADANDAELAKGFISVRVTADAISPASLAMVSRLLAPFTGFFVLVVEGTYAISVPNVTTVTVETVVVCNIQPG